MIDVNWEEVIWEDHPDFTAVTDENMEDGGRWHNSYDRVFEHKDGDFYDVSWTRGATEYQDEGVDNIRVVQVFPKEITVTVYVTKDKLDSAFAKV